jgi:hypothetical protein
MHGMAFQGGSIASVLFFAFLESLAQVFLGTLQDCLRSSCHSFLDKFGGLAYWVSPARDVAFMVLYFTEIYMVSFLFSL